MTFIMSKKTTSSPSYLLLATALLFAVIMCSSAGTAFAYLCSSLDVKPALAVSFRLWCCEIVQLIPFGISLNSILRQKNSDKETDDSLLQNEKNERVGNGDTTFSFPKYFLAFPLMAASGICLGIHFSAWVYSIEKTSLTHSLLWVSMGPIILNWGQWILYSTFLLLRTFSMKVQTNIISKPSTIESIGAVIGLFGAIIMLLDIHDDTKESTSSTTTLSSPQGNSPTLEGDMAAFLGAFAVSIYLLIGNNLRTWIPLWLYTFPVIFFALLTSIALAFYMDPSRPAQLSGFTGNSVFGFLNLKYFWVSLYLGVGPGICGHTLLNALLKYMSPLTISTAMLGEPIFGSIIGYLFSMQAFPGLFTWIGGSIILVGILLIQVGETDPLPEERVTALQNNTDLENYQQKQLLQNASCEIQYSSYDSIKQSK